MNCMTIKFFGKKEKLKKENENYGTIACVQKPNNRYVQPFLFLA